MKEQIELWPEDAKRAREEAGEDWRPPEDATRVEGEPSYRTKKEKVRKFLRDTIRNLEEKVKQNKK